MPDGNNEETAESILFPGHGFTAMPKNCSSFPKEESLFVNKYNRYYWMKLNACEPLPQISIIGEDNMAFYKGEKADLVYPATAIRSMPPIILPAFPAMPRG